MNNVFKNFFNQIGFKTKEMSAKDIVKAEIDEEIEIHRQCDSYKNNFTLRQSLNDFEDWISWLNSIKKDLLN